MAARTRFFRARSLILSPSKKSIARHALPPRPALKSLSGSGRIAPWEKVSFTLSLWALPTAMIPSRDHTGLPIHFHSSMISRSASRMLLRMPASVSPRQSVSFAISLSMRSDGFIGRDRIMLMVKAITPEAHPQPNRSRHEWARWDAYIYTDDPDSLYAEFVDKGVPMQRELANTSDGLRAFEIADNSGYLLCFGRPVDK